MARRAKYPRPILASADSLIGPSYLPAAPGVIAIWLSPWRPDSLQCKRSQPDRSLLPALPPPATLLSRLHFSMQAGSFCALAGVDTVKLIMMPAAAIATSIFMGGSLALTASAT